MSWATDGKRIGIDRACKAWTTRRSAAENPLWALLWKSAGLASETALRRH